MKILLAILLIPLVLARQDEAELEKKVKGLVDQLSDESIDGRDRAAEDLLKLGRPAERAIRAQLALTEGEVRARLVGILKELDRRDRMKDYLGGVTLVTLQKENATVKELLDEIRKLTSMKINSGMVSRDERPITVNLEKVPLLQAIDEICRAHGEMMFDVETYGKEPTLTLRKQKYVAVPRLFKEQFAVWLKEVVMTRSVDLSNGGEQRTTDLQVHVGWEPGTKPIGVRFHVGAIDDDLGKSYLDAMRKDQMDYTWGYVPSQLTIHLTALPQEGAKKLALVKGSFEFLFPQDMDVVRIEAASLAKDASAKGQSMEIKILESARTGADLRLKFSVKRTAEQFNPEYKLIAKGGKEIGYHRSSSSYVGSDMVQDMTFKVGDQELIEFRVTVPVGSREKTVGFEFKDVRIR